jgi:hypothetical protein
MKGGDFRDRLMGDGKHVAMTKVGDYIISTVLLPEFSHRLDRFLSATCPDDSYHPYLMPSWHEVNTAVVFETMIFEAKSGEGYDEKDDYQDRCATYDEAVAQHEWAVRLVQLMSGLAGRAEGKFRINSRHAISRRRLMGSA